MMKIKIKIKRCDPLKTMGCEPYWQAYSVKVSEGMTILEALMDISTGDDPTLSFRRSCRSAICGSCAIMVNGYPRLACHMQIIPEFEKSGRIVLEPVSNYKVLKDLVVDFEPFWRKMEKIVPYLLPKKELKKGWLISKSDALKIDRVQKCIMCGACNAACNSLEGDRYFIGPAASAKAWRFIGDVREGQKKKRLERISGEHGVWECTRCISCNEYCPKEVGPLGCIEKIRAKAMEAGITDNAGAKHTLALVDSVERVGRLDEAAMTFKTLGFLRSLGMIPLGLKMEWHGKMPHPILFPAIEGIKEVKKIYRVVEKQKEKRNKGK